MYYNNCTLEQLLDLALRVPEVGAVNFNFIYHILKTIISKHGLRDTIPFILLETPLSPPTSATEIQLKQASLKRSNSAESVTKIREETLADSSVEKVSKDIKIWVTQTVFTKLHTFEHEMDKIRVSHVQLDDNVSKLQQLETKSVKKIEYLQSSMKEQESKLLAKISYVQRSLEEKLKLKKDDFLHEVVEDMANKLSDLTERVNGLSAALADVEGDEEETSGKVSPKEYKMIKKGSKAVSELPESDSESKTLEPKKTELKDTEPKKTVPKVEPKSTEPKKTVPKVEPKSTEHKKTEPKKAVPKTEPKKTASKIEQKKSESKLTERKSQSNQKDLQKAKSKEKPDFGDLDKTEVKEETPEKPTVEKEDKTKMVERKKSQLEVSEPSDSTAKSEKTKKVPPKKMFKKKVNKVTEKPSIPKVQISDVVTLIKKQMEDERLKMQQETKETDAKITETKDAVKKCGREMLNVFAEIKKLKDKCKCNEFDKRVTPELNVLKEKASFLEETVGKYYEDLEKMKVNFRNMREEMKNIEKDPSSKTELSAIMKRFEELEAYVKSNVQQRPQENLITATTKKAAEDVKRPGDDKRSVRTGIKEKKAVTLKAHAFGDIIKETGDEEKGTRPEKHLRTIVPAKNIEKRSQAPDHSGDLYNLPENEEEPEEHKRKVPAEKRGTDKFSDLKELPFYPEATEKSFTPTNVLDEHSYQLKAQVIVFVKKRLRDFELELQHAEGNVASMKTKIDNLEKYSKDLGDKLTFMDANFGQRTRDFAFLKEMAENHQISIVNIMHHLDRKAEAYALNQKVSRKELTVIEDRVLKLCVTTSTEITKIEELINDEIQKFNSELDKKMFTEVFELHCQKFLHKFKMIEMKLKELSAKPAIFDFEDVRPVEITRYVPKGGTKVKQVPKIANSKFMSDQRGFGPVLDYRAEAEVSPRTAQRVQRELELASRRESTRYAEGAYTKIKAGRK